MGRESERLEKWPFARECPVLPPGAYAERRSRCPISQVELWDGSSAWLLTRYADIRAALRDARFSSDSSVPRFPAPNEAIAAARRVQRGFVRLDGEDHNRQRRLLAPYFTVNHVQSLRPLVEEKVNALLDAMETHGGPVDLVECLAEPLPVFLTCALLGLSSDDSPYLLDRVKTWMSADSKAEDATKAANDIIDFFRRVIEIETANPTGGMVAELIRQHVMEGDISQEELLWMLHLLLVGGFDTAANMISLGTVTLLNHPHELAQMTADPSRVTKVVEELLRFHSVAHFTAGRLAKEDLIVGDQAIHAGEGIVAPLPAANFDPAAFPDPERFNPDRNARTHLAFGFGIHQCLGQPVARLELSIVFAQLFKRFPTLRLAVPESDLAYNNSMIYGLRRLPITW